ncbi:MAG: hypothetical protein Q7T74_02415 [Candidatus Saccharibacteria bacterium]|nr:hypothetical protein [Candidatus Saccharibacteria bacterium]
MDTATHRTQISLTEEQYRYLRRQAEKQKASIAQIVRDIIDERLPKDTDYDENPLFALGQDGFKMGRKQGSQRHDDYIYQKGK